MKKPSFAPPPLDTALADVPESFPAPRRSWPALLASLLLAAPLGAQVRIVAAGDSITVGIGASVVPEGGYPARLDALLGPNFTVQREATSGATLLRRGNPSYRETGSLPITLAARPDIITLLLGTNDSKASNWIHASEFVDDYVALIDLYRDQAGDPEIYPALPPPATDVQIRGSVIADEVIPGILEAARRRGLPVIDLHTPFRDSVQTLLPDGVHPNDVGYQLIAERMRDALVNDRVLRPLPAPWQRLDVGATGLAGADALDDNNSLLVLGGGAAIGGRADAFRFVHQTSSGDSEVVARVALQSAFDPLAPGATDAAAGVMIRESLAHDSRHVAALITPGQGVSFRWREARGGTTGSTTVGNISGPVWLRVSRDADDFSGYYSTDGVSWIQIGGSRRIALSRGAYAGLAVNSARPRQLDRVRFEQARISRQPGAAPLAPENLSATAASGVVNLVWTPSPGADSYRVLRAGSPDGTFTERGVATGPAFTDGSASSGATYHYAVVARGASAESAASMLAQVGPPAAPTGVQARMISPSRALITWNPRDEARGFRIKRSTGRGGYVSVATVGDGVTSYTDTGLSERFIYSYVVTALNASGESAASAAAGAAPVMNYPHTGGARVSAGQRAWSSVRGSRGFMERARPEAVNVPGER